MSSPEPAKRPDLRILIGVLPVTEFSGDHPAMGVVPGSWALLSRSNPAKGVYCWHGFQQLGDDSFIPEESWVHLMSTIQLGIFLESLDG